MSVVSNYSFEMLGGCYASGGFDHSTPQYLIVLGRCVFCHFNLLQLRYKFCSVYYEADMCAFAYYALTIFC